MISPINAASWLQTVCPAFPRASRLLLAAVLPLTVLPSARPAGEEEIAVVSSKVSDDYVRTKLPDGTFQPEAYTFGEGGHQAAPMRDASLEKVSFKDVIRTVAGPLATQRYLPTADPEKARLLIMVYWGSTASAAGATGSVAYEALQHNQPPPPPPPPPPPSGGAGRIPQARNTGGALDDSGEAYFTITQMANHERDRANNRTAGVLGYDSALQDSRDLEFSGLRGHRQDLLEELEDGRYFVVLLAYDFNLMWKQKKAKLLWETRFSIRSHGNEFDKQLAAMVLTASRYFGQDTHGLARKPLPEGHVKMDDVKILGVVPEK